FRVAEGETHLSDPLHGEGGNFRFEVVPEALAGEALGEESVTIKVTVRPYPPNESIQPEVVNPTLFSKHTCAIPRLPWRLKFENFDQKTNPRKAIICVIPDPERSATKERLKDRGDQMDEKRIKWRIRESYQP